MSFYTNTTTVQLHDKSFFYYYHYYYCYLYSYQGAVDAAARALVLTETSFPFTADGKALGLRAKTGGKTRQHLQNGGENNVGATAVE